jgi:hypothetical protein
MLNNKDFHFSKDFQTRNYHGNKVVQLKRIKLCRRYFREIFAVVMREVQNTDRKNNINRKYPGKFRLNLAPFNLISERTNLSSLFTAAPKRKN